MACSTLTVAGQSVPSHGVFFFCFVPFMNLKAVACYNVRKDWLVAGGISMNFPICYNVSKVIFQLISSMMSVLYQKGLWEHSVTKGNPG